MRQKLDPQGPTVDGEHVVIRTGISYGRVLVEKRGDIVDHFGNTVNAAARMMARSVGGEIVLSVVVRKDPEARVLLDQAKVRETLAFPKGIESGLTVLHVDPASI